MKVILIKPKIGRKRTIDYVEEGRMEPLQLAVLAAQIPDDVEVKFYDDRYESIPFDEPADLVAITVEAFTAKRSYEISREFRSRGVKVIMGGMHPTLLPEEVAEHADSVYTGDSEELWPGVIEDLKNGDLKPLYNGKPGIPHPGFFPDRTIFNGKSYLPVTLIQFSRGCCFKCNFCATSTFFNSRHYCRLKEEVLKEIIQTGKKLFFFVDDNFTANVPAAKAFLKELIPLKIAWLGQLSIDAAEDLELVELMRASGCLGFVTGFESIELKNLHWMNKRQNLKHYNKYHRQIQIFYDHGFLIWAAFTLGHDFDTKETIYNILEFALKNKFAFSAFNILTPYPGTPLYNKMREEGRLLYDGKWWLHKDYCFNHAVFTPKNMTADELTEYGYTARKEFNSLWNITRRVFNVRINLNFLLKLKLIFKYSLVFRREIYRKQDLIMGNEV